MTVTTHLSLLGAEGKAVARDFIVWLLKSGVKPTIKRRPLVGERHGALCHLEFYAHGITGTWVVEKVLIVLVGCESQVCAGCWACTLSLPTQLLITLEPSLLQRHTGDNIKKWTDDALESIGLTESDLLGLQAA